MFLRHSVIFTIKEKIIKTHIYRWAEKIAVVVLVRKGRSKTSFKNPDKCGSYCLHCAISDPPPHVVLRTVLFCGNNIM